MTLLAAIQTYTGIQDPILLELFTGTVFVVGSLLIVSIFTKFLFRLFY